jgi:hypothetical protein
MLLDMPPAGARDVLRARWRNRSRTRYRPRRSHVGSLVGEYVERRRIGR